MEEKPPTVVIVGRLDKNRRKGHAELIRSWRHVAAVVPKARLLIVGDGPGLHELRREARDSGATDGIEFLGFVPEGEMEDLWARVDVCAMPSRGEGFGLVYVEAMRHGVPVVASIHDAASEVNVEGETGFNVDLDRPSELVERLVYLLSQPDAARRIGKRGQERWAKHFRYSAFRARFRPILAGFLSRGVTALG
ncbi:MAG: glycosyltransferase [Gemmatimonadales bacterium]|nr:glycosyltransferase [Gemmatimonadales bacterium]